MNIVIGASRWRYALLLVVSLAFVAAGIFLIAVPPSPGEPATEKQFLNWFGLVFFAGCALVAAWQLIDSRPRLIIDDEGIYDRTLGVGRIPWSEIQAARLQSVSGNNFICLEVREAERYLRRASIVKRTLARANAATGFTPISLNLSGVAADSNEILELILKRIEQRAGAA